MGDDFRERLLALRERWMRALEQDAEAGLKPGYCIDSQKVDWAANREHLAAAVRHATEALVADEAHRLRMAAPTLKLRDVGGSLIEMADLERGKADPDHVRRGK